MLKILKYLTKKDWLLVLYSFAFVIVQVYLDLKLPDYMSEITMLVQTSNSEMGEILRAGGYMLSCALGSLLASFIVGYFAAKIATNLSWRLRSNVYDKIEGFSPAEINNSFNKRYNSSTKYGGNETSINNESSYNSSLGTR